LSKVPGTARHQAEKSSLNMNMLLETYRGWEIAETDLNSRKRDFGVFTLIIKQIVLW